MPFPFGPPDPPPGGEDEQRPRTKLLVLFIVGLWFLVCGIVLKFMLE